MQIREEQSEDHAIIRQITELAFAPKAYSDGTEGELVDKLRASGELQLSLVAIIDGNVVGHVAFSPVTIGEYNSGWFGLGPVSVHPDRQRQGIGSALIQEGLQRLKTENARGCALIGDPAYYSRFGFQSDDRVQYQEVPAKNVQWLGFGDERPVGELLFSASFGE
jgi:putative acetyltransferase